MEYRSLGRTGVKVSELCLGTMMFGRNTNEQDSIAIVEHALEQGINFIDTANAYSAGARARCWQPRCSFRKTPRIRMRAA